MSAMDGAECQQTKTILLANRRAQDCPYKKSVNGTAGPSPANERVSANGGDKVNQKEADPSGGHCGEGARAVPKRNRLMGPRAPSPANERASAYGAQIKSTKQERRSFAANYGGYHLWSQKKSVNGTAGALARK